jgi:2-amino-4-hydroxy-6-hydroxymethyldihydropteridine diphosphokinase/dihydropteroate synthase
MAILNVTPDSFSDGGKYYGRDTDALEAEVRRLIAEGASIIDVGGQSTRPNASMIPWQEELERILPVIESIRAMPEAQNIAISVDTFYAEVARGAVAAGADIINDVSGGMLDAQMLPTIADLQITVVLMHMRGTPNTMKDMTDYPDGVVEGVANELLDRVRGAERCGIPRWRIVLDPGIGFAKTQAQNLELLRNLDVLRNWPGLRNFPWLVGTSRKGFIGKITGVPSAPERGWGTAATVTTSVAGGADIVRVHDVSEMMQVVKMADAMYRVKPQLQKG